MTLSKVMWNLNHPERPVPERFPRWLARSIPELGAEADRVFELLQAQGWSRLAFEAPPTVVPPVVAIDTVTSLGDALRDSSADMAEIYRGFEQKWLTLLQGEPTRAELLRDVLELATWEDFGLTEGVEGFLSGLGEQDADRELAELAVIVGELREHRLEYQLERARGLRSAVLAAVAGFSDEDADGEE